MQGKRKFEEKKHELKVFYDSDSWDDVHYAFLTYGNRGDVRAEIVKHGGKATPLYLLPKAEEYLARTAPSHLRAFFSEAEKSSKINEKAVLVWDVELESFQSVSDLKGKRFLQPGDHYRTTHSGFHLVANQAETAITAFLVYLKEGVSEEDLGEALAYLGDGKEEWNVFLKNFSFMGTSPSAAITLGEMFASKKEDVMPTILLDESDNSYGDSISWTTFVADISKSVRVLLLPNRRS